MNNVQINKYLKILLVFLLFQVFLSLFVYVYGLQGTETTISKITVIQAIVIGTIGSIFMMFLQRPDFRTGQIDLSRIKTSLAKASGLCLIFFIAFPMPYNNLLYPISTFKVDIAAESTSESVRVDWLGSGLTDIYYRDVTMPSGSSYDKSEIRLALDDSGNTSFSWRGRSRDQITIVLLSYSKLDIKVNLNGNTSYFTLDPEDNPKLFINVPVNMTGSYLLQFILTIISGLFVGALLLSLLDWMNLRRILIWLNRIIPEKVTKLPFHSFSWVIFSILGLWIIGIGFNNRMYADDFWYAATLRDMGYWESIQHFYLIANGRFMSHLVNFAAWFLGKTSILLGAIIIILGLGGSLFFLLFQTIDSTNLSVRLRKAALYALMIIICVLLLQPDLYESTYWTIHALIVTGGLGLTTLTAGVILYMDRTGKTKNKSASSIRSLGTIILMFLLGFMSGGFNEAVSLFIIVLSAGGFILIKTNRLTGFDKRNTSNWLLAFFLGSLIATLIVVSAPGNLKRTDTLGFNLSINEIKNYYFAAYRGKFLYLFIKDYGVRLFLFGALVLFGYRFGRDKPGMRKYKLVGRNSFENSMFSIAPFIFTLIPFTLSGFIKGYFPERTLFFPIYILSVTSFLAAAWSGSSQNRPTNSIKQNQTPNKIVSLTSFLVILIIGIGAARYLYPFDNQMRLFAKEWDNRELNIQRALELNEEKVEVVPFQHTFGTDLSVYENLWLYDVLQDYYGIEFVLKY